MIKLFKPENDFHEFSCNTYVISDSIGNCVIIDLGYNGKKIAEYVKTNFKNCLAILLTHGHWDHIRGINDFLDEFPNCEIFIDENDAEMLINSRLNCSKDMFKIEGIVNIEPYRFEDQDEIKFSKELVFTVIETPFHTEGSSCFLYENENALFTGDTLFKGNIGRSDLPHSAKRYQNESLRKLKLLDPSLKIYPGHGELSTLESELKNNLYLK